MKNSAPSPGLRARLATTVTTGMLGCKVYPVRPDATDLAATPVSMERRVRRARLVCLGTTG